MLHAFARINGSRNKMQTHAFDRFDNNNVALVKKIKAQYDVERLNKQFRSIWS